MKLAVVTASLGGIDVDVPHVEQTMPCFFHRFTDENFPPRSKAMTPRLQAKIPKMFAWQLVPGHDYYLWLDGSIKLKSPVAAQYFYDQVQGYDVAVIKHRTHPDIRQEVRYTRKGVKQKNRHILPRYQNEFYIEQYDAILADKDFVDDSLYLGGIFIYRNTEKVQEMLKEWWYNVSRYCLQDQLSWAYVLKKSGVKIKVLPGNIENLIDDGLIDHYRHLFREK